MVFLILTILLGLIFVYRVVKAVQAYRNAVAARRLALLNLTRAFDCLAEPVDPVGRAR